MKNGISLEDFMTKQYGKKGTKSRTEADERIEALAKDLPIKIKSYKSVRKQK